MGKATVPLQGSEGKLRYWHLRIRDYAESICFYKGKRTEASRVNALLEEVYAGRLKQLKAYVRGARKGEAAVNEVGRTCHFWARAN